MENIHCLVISFRQTEDEPEYIYFVSQREIKQGDIYLDGSKSNFMKVVFRGTEPLGSRCRRLEASSNPRYHSGTHMSPMCQSPLERLISSVVRQSKKRP